MNPVGTFIFCWNTLEHLGDYFEKTLLHVGTKKLFRNLLECSMKTQIT
jgi:hypothetical protein